MMGIKLTRISKRGTCWVLILINFVRTLSTNQFRNVGHPSMWYILQFRYLWWQLYNHHLLIKIHDGIFEIGYCKHMVCMIFHDCRTSCSSEESLLYNNWDYHMKEHLTDTCFFSAVDMSIMKIHLNASISIVILVHVFPRDNAKVRLAKRKLNVDHGLTSYVN